MLHRDCGGQVRLTRRCPKCQRDVEFGEIAKGYEVERGIHAVFTLEELAKLGDNDARGTIEIVSFVEQASVDFSYIDRTYWMGPGGRNARGFALLRDVLAETSRVALAKTQLRSRTRLALVRPYGHLLAMERLRYDDEIERPDAIAVPDPAPPTPRERALAHDLVRAVSGTFDPAQHADRYRAAVEAAVVDKTAASELSRQPATRDEVLLATDGKLIDLAELLTRSLARLEPAPERARRRRRA